MGKWGAGRSQQEKDSTSCLPLLPGIRSMRGGVAGEGIWLRHLRTSAGGGGKKGRAGELAPAAGTAGAHGPRSPIPFPVWPQAWASSGAELPSRVSERAIVVEVPLCVLEHLWAHVGEQTAEMATWAQRDWLPTPSCWVVPPALHSGAGSWSLA